MLVEQQTNMQAKDKKTRENRVLPGSKWVYGFIVALSFASYDEGQLIRIALERLFTRAVQYLGWLTSFRFSRSQSLRVARAYLLTYLVSTHCILHPPVPFFQYRRLFH